MKKPLPHNMYLRHSLGLPTIIKGKTIKMFLFTFSDKLTFRLKLKIYGIFILLIIIASISVYAQERAVLDEQSSLGELNRRIREIEKKSKETKGSPFLFEEWKKGIVVNNNGDHINTYVNYNVYTDEMHVTNPRSTGVILQKNFADSIFIINNDTTLLFVHLNNSENLKNGIYQVLYDGNISLVVKRSKRLDRPNNKGAFPGDRKSNEFVVNDRYFVKSDDSFSNIRLTKSSLKKTFKPYKSSIQDYLKEHSDVDANTEEGFVETIKFLDAHID